MPCLANGRVHEESAPLVITEDNQTSTVRVVNRTPIITSTVTVTNGVSDISNEVRYYLDPSDVAKNREIGTTLFVTPSILPDNTIRLQIDGTVSTIVGETPVPTSLGAGAIVNNYPIVNEAHLVNLSRVPSGYSLILGGFVSVDNSVQNNKVPILGSLPLLGQAFRYKVRFTYPDEPGIYHYAHRIPGCQSRSSGCGQRIQPASRSSVRNMTSC